MTRKVSPTRIELRLKLALDRLVCPGSGMGSEVTLAIGRRHPLCAEKSRADPSFAGTSCGETGASVADDSAGAGVAACSLLIMGVLLALEASVTCSGVEFGVTPTWAKAGGTTGLASKAIPTTAER